MRQGAVQTHDQEGKQVEILREMVDDIEILILHGRLDSSHAKEFKKEIDILEKENRVRIVLDMEGVSFIDSAGLGALISALRAANRQGGDIRIGSLQPQSRALFELVRLHKVFAIFNNREEAIKSFQEQSDS